MPAVTNAEFGIDHKHWLNELERWEVYLRDWRSQHASATADFSAFLKEHEQLLEEYALGIDSLRHAIAECERSSVAPSSGQERHHSEAATHDHVQAQHERLQVASHKLLSARALLTREP